MWTPEHRRAANRKGLRYPSDLTDDEWALVAPMIPPARHGGRKRSVNVREVLNGIFYVLWTGSNGRRCPKTYRRRARCTTISNSGTGTARWSASIMRFTLWCVSRKDAKPARRQRSSIRRPPRAPKRRAWLDPSGYDAGKKIKGRKRHILVDTLGLLLRVVVQPADVQDRDGALQLLRRARRMFPFIERIFADGGYAGPKMALVARRTGIWRLQIVKRSDAAGFEVLPKRWIVERTFSWINRNRRLSRDFECYAATVVAFVRLAMIRVMLRRLAATASS